jgi:DNA-binding beta-propeller fold protein YncE
MAASQLALSTDPAAAFEGYGLPTFFGSVGSGDGQFFRPAGVAVNDATDEVYVYDSGNLRVERFDSTGAKFEGQFNGSGLLAGEGSPAPTGQFAPPASISEDAAHGTLFNLAVDNAAASPSKGDVYVVDPGHNVIDKFTAAGAYIFQLTGFKLPVFGVAVDTSGNVWVTEEGRAGGEFAPVQEFDNAVENKHVSELTPIGLRSPGIALDSEGNLYLAMEGQNVSKFNKAGTFEEQATVCGCGTALAIDAASNDLFFDEGKSISRYLHNVKESPAETFTGVSGSDGVAVNSATHVIYASQLAANSVAVFNFGLLPDVTTGSASEVTRTTAKLEGEVNPDGQEVTSCEFEYGPTEAYGKIVACSAPPGSGTSPVAVSAEATELTAGGANHFRLVAGNANGRHPGADAELTTPPAVENVKTEGSTAVTAHTATVEGSFEPNGFDTHYRFEYINVGPPPFKLSEIEKLQAFFKGAPGSRTPLQDGGSASEDKHVSEELTGLPPNALIFYRIVAENQFGLTVPFPSVFKTPITAPVILGAPSATFVAAQSADLNANLNPEHTLTHYHFEYGPCPTLTGCASIQSTPEKSSSLFGQIGTSAEVVGLAPSTTYSYRLVAVNEFEEAGETKHETAIGPEGTFTTAPAPMPSVQTGASTVLGATSAAIGGVVSPNGAPTSYAFELGVYEGAATQYGVVASGSAGSGTTPVTVGLTLSGLQPGTTYAYRLSIASGYLPGAGSAQGATVMFTTPGLPAAIAPPPLLAQLPVPSIRFPGPTPPKCKKGFRRDKHGKCVRQKRKKKRGARRKKARARKGSS